MATTTTQTSQPSNFWQWFQYLSTPMPGIASPQQESNALQSQPQQQIQRALNNTVAPWLNMRSLFWIIGAAVLLIVGLLMIADDNSKAVSIGVSAVK